MMMMMMMRRAALLLLPLIAACPARPPPPPPPPPVATHVVPPDLRDVERAGEGMVSTTFGEYPARIPDWTRAAGVQAVLVQVWDRSKAATPDLPSASVTAVDDAVAALAVAIPAQNQQDAAFAANKVGLAVPELFDFFHPDAPKAIVRMDAVYRQVGLDAHFGDPTGVTADVTSLQSDWDGARAAIEARVPTCHRVAGTATIAGDIDASLANLSTATDTDTQERESENGALQVDVLELLFDCPPDDVVPGTGLGSACTSTADCDPGQVCDTANAGGRCAPDPSTAAIGGPCGTTVDCGTDSRSACQTEAGDNYPGGYCFMEPCDDVQVCPPGATCVSLGGETAGCFQSCTADADCRTAEGYTCQLFSTTPPTGFGPSDHACAFPCTRDADCHAPLTCVVATGKCTP